MAEKRTVEGWTHGEPVRFRLSSTSGPWKEGTIYIGAENLVYVFLPNTNDINTGKYYGVSKGCHDSYSRVYNLQRLNATTTYTEVQSVQNEETKMPIFNVVVTQKVQKKLSETEYQHVERVVASVQSVVAVDEKAAAFIVGATAVEQGNPEDLSPVTVTVTKVA